MKFMQAGVLAASVLCAAGFVGCSTTPHSHNDAMGPKVVVSANHNTINQGEAVLVTANTANLVTAKELKWTVTPTTGHLTAQKDSAGLGAIFTADQPGTYVIRAPATDANGQVVADETTITVNGRAAN